MSLFWKILVFDEGTESVDIATNENILYLDEYSNRVPYVYTEFGEGVTVQLNNIFISINLIPLGVLLR
jgi:hypothetical protein